MLRWFLRKLRGRDQGPSAAEELFALSHEEIEHLLTTVEGLPQVDWGMAEAWIAHRQQQFKRPVEAIKRAVAAAWLDQLREAVTTDSRHWRSATVEGLAPAAGNVGPRVAGCADRCIRVIGKALTELRGDPRTNPIPPVAVVALGTAEEYYSFVSHFYSEEGEYATSGGIYIRADEGFPVLAINAQTRFNLEAVVAHELTHHALKPRAEREEFGGLPLWVEEGLTQMMEEHVTRATNFAFGREMLERHQALWSEIGFDGFLEGETFHSPEDDRQELSYNLAEALVRSLLATRAKDFWSFARMCMEGKSTPDDAAREHFGAAPEELGARLVQIELDEFS